MAEAAPKAARKAERVSAMVVQVTTKDGRAVQMYRDDVVTDNITAESLAHLRSLGFVTED